MEELLDEGVVKGGIGAIRGAEGGDGVVIEEERGEEGCGVAVVDGGDGVWQDPRPLGALAGIRALSGVGVGLPLSTCRAAHQITCKLVIVTCTLQTRVLITRLSCSVVLQAATGR